jgi:hypothetical protein
MFKNISKLEIEAGESEREEVLEGIRKRQLCKSTMLM